MKCFLIPFHSSKELNNTLLRTLRRAPSVPNQLSGGAR
jgi:hypothetical protein